MKGIAASLTDQDIADLAAYRRSQRRGGGVALESSSRF